MADSKVKDLSLADFGRKELNMAESTFSILQYKFSSAKRFQNDHVFDRRKFSNFCLTESFLVFGLRFKIVSQK